MTQRPTCTGIRVRTVEDCNVIFHAVFLNLLPMISRRLTTEERRAIHSGCVFVWEEHTPSTISIKGLERWTDSRRWSASRPAKDFLYYHEKIPETDDPSLSAAMYQNRLIKQTYSVFLRVGKDRRKWHLVAYYLADGKETLGTVDDIPALADIRHSVPEGKYEPARVTRAARPLRSHPPETRPDSRSSGDSSLDVPPGPLPSVTNINSGLIAPTWEPPQHPMAPWTHDLSPLPGIPSSPRRDPGWVLENCTPVNPDTYFLTGDAPMHVVPARPQLQTKSYNARHPLDNDALRSFDGIP